MFRDVMNLIIGQMFDSVGYDPDILSQRVQFAIAFIGAPPFTFF